MRRISLSCFSAFLLCGFLFSQVAPEATAKVGAISTYGKLPLSFEKNQGQTDAAVKFLARGQGYTLYLTAGEAVLATKAHDVMRMKLLGADAAAGATGLEEMAGKSNYFIGNDPTKWRTNVPTFAKVKFSNVYSGIDLVYYGNQRQLEYDFVVAPGADPKRIQFEFEGAKLRRGGHGDLVLKTSQGELQWHKPVAYQEKDGRRQEIAARYAIKDKDRVDFEIAAYDHKKPLFIDPLVYSTYLGGSNIDYGVAIAVDNAGSAYVTGYTTSSNFPTANSLQPACGSCNPNVTGNAFVAKLNTAGSSLVYSTYLGGSGDDRGAGIAVDAAGNAYIIGTARSTDFPTANPLQPTCGGCSSGFNDAFVAELNPTGSALIYSTYLGGTNADYGHGIAVDSSGAAYVVGATYSQDFPTANALQPVNAGDPNAFVAKISPGGSALVYSTYLGGKNGDGGQAIAVDSGGNVYITGQTSSNNFPTKNPLQPAKGGGNDAFVAKINSGGSALVYSTYLGGSMDDIGLGIAVDSSDSAYVSGQTYSTNFPTANPFQAANAGKYNAFVTKLNSAGSALVYSTYLGGSQTDLSYGIAVDGGGNAYVTGFAYSSDFPTVNAVQPTCASCTTYPDAFVAEFNAAGSVLVYSTYLGGNNDDRGNAIAVDNSGNAYIIGQASSSNFPTWNPLQPASGGGIDAFVAKISQPVVNFNPPTLNFGNQVPHTSAQKSSTLTNISSGPLTVGPITVSGANSGDFSESDTCNMPLANGGSCTITVTFDPSAIGARTAQLNIPDRAGERPDILPLSGTGFSAIASLPSSVAFGNQVVNTTSSPKTVKLTNTGNATLDINNISTNAPFAVSSTTCGATLAPKGSCLINVTFTPPSTGPFTGTLTITDNAANSPQKVALSGTGVLPVTLTPSSAMYASQTVGTTSAAKTFTLTNNQTVTLNNIVIGFTGADPGDFSVSSTTCGSTLASKARCTINVVFKPTATGTRTANLSVSDDASNSPQTSSLTGTGK